MTPGPDDVPDEYDVEQTEKTEKTPLLVVLGSDDGVGVCGLGGECS